MQRSDATPEAGRSTPTNFLLGEALFLSLYGLDNNLAVSGLSPLYLNILISIERVSPKNFLLIIHSVLILIPWALPQSAGNYPPLLMDRKQLTCNCNLIIIDKHGTE